MTPEIERRVGGRYVLRSPLGAGGAGTVWTADDEMLQRRVAVKAVRVRDPATDEGSESLERVLREARAAARLNHPGAVTVFDVFDEDGCAYLVMELVAGPSLQTRVERDGPLDPHTAARIGLALVDVLEAAHGRGIVHRDVKPSNVLVPEDGRPKLTDFGIATVAGDSRITATGLVLGSPSYIAPEQAREGTGHAAADLWGLGATLYFAVEGRAAFDRGQPLATVHAVLHDEPRPAERAGSLSPLLGELLTKDPRQRPPTAAVRRRLQDVVSPRDDGRSAAPTQPVEGRPAEPSPQPAPPRRPATAPRRVLLAVVVALLAIGGLAGANVLLGDSPGADQAAPGQEADEAAPAPSPGGEQADGPADDEQPADPPDEAAGEQDAGTAPGDWVTYTDEVGWSIAHPPGWEIVDRGGTIVDVRDPHSPTYMRVDYTDDPPESAVGAWEQMSASFAASRTNYTELRIEPVTFQGYEGALWEYTYTEGGLDLRAANLGFGTDEFGHALNFQTAAADWEDFQDTHQAFRDSFRPAAG